VELGDLVLQSSVLSIDGIDVLGEDVDFLGLLGVLLSFFPADFLVMMAPLWRLRVDVITVGS